MNRYYDLIAQIAAAMFAIGGIGGMLAGNYLMMLAGFALAVVLWSYSKHLKKIEDQMVFEEENPISANRTRLKDQSIIDKIKNVSFDPMDYKLKDLEKGSMLEFKTHSWMVDQMKFIYWKNAEGGMEGKLSKKAILNMDNKEYQIQVNHSIPNAMVPLTNPISIYSIDSKMDAYVSNNKFNPPTVLKYKDLEFYRESKKTGYEIDPADYSYQEFDSFDYFDENKNNIIRLNYWGKTAIEAEYGEMMKEVSFVNILPAPEDDNLLITE